MLRLLNWILSRICDYAGIARYGNGPDDRGELGERDSIGVGRPRRGTLAEKTRWYNEQALFEQSKGAHND